MAAYITHQSDAAMTVVPWAIPMVEGRRTTTPIYFGNNGDSESGYVFFARPEVIAGQADLLRRFLRASYKAYQLAHEQPDEAAAAIARDVPGTDKKLAHDQLVTMSPFECGPHQAGKLFGSQQLADWQVPIDMFVKTGLVTTKLDANKVFSNQFFEGKDPVSSVVCKN